LLSPSLVRRPAASEVLEILARPRAVSRQADRLDAVERAHDAAAEDDAAHAAAAARAADDSRGLPLGRRAVDLALAGHRRGRSPQTLVEADEVETGRRAGNELRAERGEAPRRAPRGAGAGRSA
jgi:hypothetical protein